VSGDGVADGAAGLPPTEREIARLRGILEEARRAGVSDELLAREIVERAAAVAEPSEVAHVASPPPLPIEPLGGSIAPMVAAVAEAYQVPPELPALGALATLSAAALKRVVVRVRPGWREHVALYVASILEPGERKTGSLGAVAGPLRDLETARAREMAPKVRESQHAHADAAARVAALAKKAASATKGTEAIEGALRDARAKIDGLGEPLRAPRWFADDTTPEALGRRLAEHDGRMAIFASEGGLFETLAGRYANGTPNLDLVLKGWDGAEPWIYDRVGLHLRIAEPLLAMCLFVQPDVLVALADKPGFRGRGLVGRFVYALPASRLGERNVDPPPVPHGVLLAWRLTVERIASLEDRRSEAGDLAPREIRLSGDALAVLLDYAREIESRLAPDGDLRPYSDWAGKHVGTVARISGLLHLADAAGNEERDVPAGTMERAVAFGRGLVPHAVAAIARMAGESSAETPEERERRVLVAWVAEHDGCTAREVAKGMRRFHGPGGAERAAEALDALAGKGGALCREPGPKTVRYCLRRAAPSSGVGACGLDGPADRASADADTATAPATGEVVTVWTEPDGTLRSGPALDAEGQEVEP
jgi:hypothetical protein